MFSKYFGIVFVWCPTEDGRSKTAFPTIIPFYCQNDKNAVQARRNYVKCCPYVSTKTGLQNFVPTISILSMHFVLKGLLKPMWIEQSL